MGSHSVVRCTYSFYVLPAFPRLLSFGGGKVLPRTLGSILGRGVLLQCFLKYIYSLYIVEYIITLAITKATTKLGVVFKQLITFLVQFFELVSLLKVNTFT